MEPVKVIIFEDESLLANDLRYQIQQHGYEVTAIFRKAEEGLLYMAGLTDPSEMPEVVLMDISLAGEMTGIEAAEIILRLYSCAIVFLTGMSQVSVFAEAFKTKPGAYLIKPFDLQQAIVSIKLAIYQNKLEKELLAHQAELESMILERTRSLQQAKDKAEEVIRKTDNLLGSIAREVRSPLQGISGILALMKKEASGNPEMMRYVSYIEDNTTHLNDLLNRIFDRYKAGSISER